jgi:glyoxylase-like metal-dependent hydrolase (beta-lactamase superfamily II)
MNNNVTQISENLHRIKCVFQVTDTLERFVYLYLIEAKGIHIIDTGVDGAEKQISEFLISIGRNVSEIKSILLTHSHPDHIGSAYRLKQASNATVYACGKEKEWIENIDKQFAERPIPNFYTLLNKSIQIDRIINDKDVLSLDDGVTLQVIDSKGHSAASLSFLWQEKGKLFTGDAIPVSGDIPIYTSAKQSVETLEKLLLVQGINEFLPAWDEPYNENEGRTNIQNAVNSLTRINDAVTSAMTNLPKAKGDEIYAYVCNALGLTHLLKNPLFMASVFSNIKEMGA